MVRGERFGGEPYRRDPETLQPTEPQRLTAFRHGARSNMSFFDGSARSLPEQEVIDPNLFLPRGTVIKDPADLWWNAFRPDEPIERGDVIQ